jgi:hypothetical protein
MAEEAAVFSSSKMMA